LNVIELDTKRRDRHVAKNAPRDDDFEMNDPLPSAVTTSKQVLKSNVSAVRYRINQAPTLSYDIWITTTKTMSLAEYTSGYNAISVHEMAASENLNRLA